MSLTVPCYRRFIENYLGRRFAAASVLVCVPDTSINDSTHGNSVSLNLDDGMKIGRRIVVRVVKGILKVPRHYEGDIGGLRRLLEESPDPGEWSCDRH